MTTEADGWAEVLQAVTAALAGDPTGGRRQMLACWERTQPYQHAQRCVLAHYLADTEGDLEAEIGWDERALEEHAAVGDADLAPVGIPSAGAMAPSLHLNLGEGYRRRGDLAAARVQLDLGLAAAPSLADDGYGQLVRGGLARLDRDLGPGP